jgi:predicted kinase
MGSFYGGDRQAKAAQIVAPAAASLVLLCEALMNGEAEKALAYCADVHDAVVAVHEGILAQVDPETTARWAAAVDRAITN